MDEKPKSIWKKSLTGWGWLWAWLVLLAATFFILLIVVQFIPNGPKHIVDMLPGVGIFSLVIATMVFGLLAFVKCIGYCCRHFKRFLFGLACFATLIALAYAEEDWRGWHAWNQFKHQWEAKGEKFDFASIIPPPVPDDQNFAMAPIFDATDKLASRKWQAEHRNPHYGKGGDAMPWDTNIVDRLTISLVHNYDNAPTNGTGNWQLACISNLKAWQSYYRTLAATTNEFPVAPQPQTPAQDVLLALSKYDPAIEELRQASQRPDSRFPLDYDDENSAEILLPHLADLKRCSMALQLRAIAELQNGQSEKALDDVKLMLRLTDAVRTEPFIISHLVRIALLKELHAATDLRGLGGTPVVGVAARCP